MMNNSLLYALICLVCVGVYGCDGASSNQITINDGTTDECETDPSKCETAPPENDCETDPSKCEPDPCKDVDLMTSDENCGVCGKGCGAHGQCNSGKCQCRDGYEDCDGDGICETAGECECRLGDERSCYYGPAGTENVGACHGGVQKCIKADDGSMLWEFDCVGSVEPVSVFTCQIGNPDFDQDCNGVPDSKQDEDGDGYTICSEAGEILDCCDRFDMCQTKDTHLVHPGNTIDCAGNLIDDDCDGEIDEDTDVDCNAPTVDTSCKLKIRSCSSENDYIHPDSNAVSHVEGSFFMSNCLDDSNAQASDALALLKAMDMCMDTVTVESNQSGIIEYYVSSGLDGTRMAGGRQINVLAGMKSEDGTVSMRPRVGETFALISTGDAQDVFHGYSNDRHLTIHGLDNSSPLPPIYASKHPSTSIMASYNDLGHLHIKLRAPENAKGFSIDFRFLTREYPFYINSGHNDSMLIILTDAEGRAIADTNNNGDLSDEDGNIAFDIKGNSVTVDSAFFTTCKAISCSYKFMNTELCSGLMTCQPETNTCNKCPDGMTELAGAFSSAYDGVTPGEGGATGWLTTQAPINPGQVFNLDFYIWDNTDHIYDSTMILDNFQWLCTQTAVSTEFAVPVEQIN